MSKLSVGKVTYLHHGDGIVSIHQLLFEVGNRGHVPVEQLAVRQAMVAYWYGDVPRHREEREVAVAPAPTDAIVRHDEVVIGSIEGAGVRGAELIVEVRHGEGGDEGGVGGRGRFRSEGCDLMS